MGSTSLAAHQEAAVQIDSPGVSRLHARVRIEKDVATLEDLGSKNGTLLNGTRVEAATALADGDEIRLGTVVLTSGQLLQPMRPKPLAIIDAPSRVADNHYLFHSTGLGGWCESG